MLKTEGRLDFFLNRKPMINTILINSIVLFHEMHKCKGNKKRQYIKLLIKKKQSNSL